MTSHATLGWYTGLHLRLFTKRSSGRQTLPLRFNPLQRSLWALRHSFGELKLPSSQALLRYRNAPLRLLAYKGNIGLADLAHTLSCFLEPHFKAMLALFECVLNLEIITVGNGFYKCKPKACRAFLATCVKAVEQA